jgi:hypothetical protein
MNTNNRSRIFTRFVAGPIAAAGILGGVAMGLAAGANADPVRRITRAAATRRSSAPATIRVIRTGTSGPTSGTSGSGTITGITRSAGTATADPFCLLHTEPLLDLSGRGSVHLALRLCRITPWD